MLSGWEEGKTSSLSRGVPGRLLRRGEGKGTCSPGPRRKVPQTGRPELLKLFFSTVVESNVEIKVLVGLVSPEAVLLGSQMVVLSLCLHVVVCVRVLISLLVILGPTLMTSC